MIKLKIRKYVFAYFQFDHFPKTKIDFYCKILFGPGCGLGFTFRKSLGGPSIFSLGSTLSTLGKLPGGSIHHAASSAFPQIVPLFTVSGHCPLSVALFTIHCPLLVSCSLSTVSGSVHCPLLVACQLSTVSESVHCPLLVACSVSIVSGSVSTVHCPVPCMGIISA